MPLSKRTSGNSGSSIAVAAGSLWVIRMSKAVTPADWCARSAHDACDAIAQHLDLVRAVQDADLGLIDAALARLQHDQLACCASVLAAEAVGARLDADCI